MLCLSSRCRATACTTDGDFFGGAPHGPAGLPIHDELERPEQPEPAKRYLKAGETLDGEGG